MCHGLAIIIQTWPTENIVECQVNFDHVLQTTPQPATTSHPVLSQGFFCFISRTFRSIKLNSFFYSEELNKLLSNGLGRRCAHRQDHREHRVLQRHTGHERSSRHTEEDPLDHGGLAECLSKLSVRATAQLLHIGRFALQTQGNSAQQEPLGLSKDSAASSQVQIGRAVKSQEQRQVVRAEPQEVHVDTQEQIEQFNRLAQSATTLQVGLLP